jgi:predicted metalloprotease with PDZ domain
MPFTVRHRLAIHDPRAHLVAVETRVTSEPRLSAPVVLFMPVWTPGSYLVREYARHIEGFVAFADGAPCAAVKIRKNAWKVGREGALEVTVRYLVYANDLTVRTNHVDESHALLNGAAVFLAVEGQESLSATIDVALPKGWKVMTALPRSAEDAESVRLVARDFDTLVDSPIALGQLRCERFEAKGIAHDVAIWPEGSVESKHVEGLVRDFARIVETEAAWFGGALPYDHYTALLHFAPRARGGLEHLNGAAVVAHPSSFGTRDRYLDLLSLLAHELFHAWNVKRIRPAGLFPYRYEEENYTRLLWWFEGATSYYDWRCLCVSGLCSSEEYADHLAGELAAMERVPGRLVQSLEQASFDAWIKLYRPDENSENSSVSYYRKGEIVCAMLDLEIRARSKGRASLDQVLDLLWKRHGPGASRADCGPPIPEDGMQALMEEATGVSLGDLFDAWIRSHGEIDYDRTLARVGLRLERPVPSAAGASLSRDPSAVNSGEKKARSAALGVRLRSEGSRSVVAAVLRGGAAQVAGVDAGDELISIAGVRIEGGSIDAALAPHAPGEDVVVTVAREGRVFPLKVRLDEARPDKLKIIPRTEASDEERALGAAWLLGKSFSPIA